MKSGYIVRIWSDFFEKQTIFLEDKPDEKKIKEMIKKYGGTKAYISEAKEIDIAQ